MKQLLRFVRGQKLVLILDPEGAPLHVPRKGDQFVHEGHVYEVGRATSGIAFDEDRRSLYWVTTVHVASMTEPPVPGERVGG